MHKKYILTEQQRLEIIRLLDELILPGKFVRPLTNFFEQMQPAETQSSSQSKDKTVE